jgi:hypothetical protein
MYVEFLVDKKDKLRNIIIIMLEIVLQAPHICALEKKRNSGNHVVQSWTTDYLGYPAIGSTFLILINWIVNEKFAMEIK